MCLIVFAWRADRAFPLVLGANRDEFYERPSLPAAFWPERGDLLAGRDLLKGGTWLGITRSGRFAAVTNYRQGNAQSGSPRSRGDLVRNFLTGTVVPHAYLAAVAAERSTFDGFNLLAGDMHELFHFSNRSGDPQPVRAGVHGLSNALLDTPWPKVRQAKAALSALLGADKNALIAGVFALLADRSRPPDDALPSTGVSLDWERLLSPAFIASPDYGTRCSTVLLADRHGEVTFVERSFDAAPATSDIVYTFPLSPSVARAS
ncbi:MAG: NRDE family protein [Burkholderiales bacterium]